MHTSNKRVYTNTQKSIQTTTLEDIEYDEISRIHQPIPREQIFLSLQKILSDKSDDKEIYLNTKISAILKNNSSNDNFQNDLHTTFKLPKEIIQKELNENIIVWDWINSISNYQKSLMADIEY